MTMTFEDWMKKVDMYCEARFGMSIHDLPDCPFHDWYDDGMGPSTAARKAVKMAMCE